MYPPVSGVSGNNKMNRQILTLRIISAFFLLSGVLTVIILFLAKTASALFIASTVIYQLIMITIAVGLFKLWLWARYAAIIVLILKTVQFLVVAIRDIRTMNIHSVDVTSVLFSVLMIVPIAALYFLAIWMTANFSLDGQEFVALNGGPQFTFSPGISFVVNCETQEEVDEFWEKLSAGGEQIECGWLRDKFGITWQIVPRILGELFSDPDEIKTQRVMKALMQMKKLDIALLQQAYDND